MVLTSTFDPEIDMPESDSTAARQLVLDSVCASSFRRATFAGKIRGGRACPWIRVVVRPVEIREKIHLQFSYFDAQKDVTKNYLPADAVVPLGEVYDFGFAGIHISTSTEEIDLRTSKKGKVLVGRGAASADGPAEPQPHNRVKDLPLPEGKPSSLLQIMGIQRADGAIKPTMRAKFTQINQFLVQLTHTLDGIDLPRDRRLKLLDCGCGSSYLTLAAHHYLNEVLGRPTDLLGVDVNEEVIRKSTARADAVGATSLNFSCGRIGEIDSSADIVLALHACDTATDDAIVQAIRSKATVFLAAPCCHHHLNQQLTATEPEVLRPILRHGILRERTADILTDAFRVLALRIAGYRTDVVEFVGTEHTPRNLLIRATLDGPTGDAVALAEYAELRKFWNVTPYVDRVVNEFKQSD